FEGRARRDLAEEQRAAVEDGLKYRAGYGPAPGAGREQLLHRRRRAGGISSESEVREPVRYRDAYLGARRMQVLLRGAQVGSLLDKLRRHADRQVARQLEAVKSELLRRLLVRQAAGECRKQMALLLQLPLQRRKRLLDLRQRGLLRHHVRLRDLAGVELLAQQLQHVGGDFDELSRGVDLSAQGRLLNGGDDNIRRQGQVRGLEVETRVVRLGLERFRVAAKAAEHVGRIGAQPLAGKKVEGLRFRQDQIAFFVRNRRSGNRRLLARRREIGVDG